MLGIEIWYSTIYIYQKFVAEVFYPHPVLSLIHSFSLPDVLCEPTDLIWRKGTPFEVITGRTAPSSDGLLAEVFPDFSYKADARRSVHSLQDHFIITLIISDRRD